MPSILPFSVAGGSPFFLVARPCQMFKCDCGMDFSSLASYWQIKALLMLEPSVVTPQNQYFPANSERMSVHCLESGCIGKYTHLGPQDFRWAGILHPSALEIALGQSLGPRVQNPRPWEISWASGSVFSNTSLLSAVYGYIHLMPLNVMLGC